MHETNWTAAKFLLALWPQLRSLLWPTHKVPFPMLSKPQPVEKVVSSTLEAPSAYLSSCSVSYWPCNYKGQIVRATSWHLPASRALAQNLTRPPTTFAHLPEIRSLGTKPSRSRWQKYCISDVRLREQNAPGVEPREGIMFIGLHAQSVNCTVLNSSNRSDSLE